MGFQYLAARYEMLTSSARTQKKMMKVGRSCWVKSLNGRLSGLRLSKKLSLRDFSSVLFPKRIIRIYNDIIKRVNLDNIYSAIVVPTQMGLPIFDKLFLNQ
ncbi:hypothetical protein Lal_00017130 [Lupinus albus]|nr:hypothetical protein Lal_00017130 [Lupinus albus]